MKYIITNALGLFMIFSCSLLYCAEKKPAFKTPVPTPIGKSSPIFRVHKISYMDKDKTNGEQWSEKMPRKFTSPKTSPRNTGNN